jgi:hypothetical protein
LALIIPGGTRRPSALPVAGNVSPRAAASKTAFERNAILIKTPFLNWTRNRPLSDDREPGQAALRIWFVNAMRLSMECKIAEQIGGTCRTARRNLLRS